MTKDTKRTPLAQAGREMRSHIGIYGRCNVGKSTLLNLITGARNSIVSPHSGTTTDVVRKAYEILDFAPVVFLDTAGTDDTSPLGLERVKATLDTINEVDMAVLLYREWGEPERQLVEQFSKISLPYITIRNQWSNETVGTLVEGDSIAINLIAPMEGDVDQVMDQVKRTLPERSYRTPSMFNGMVERGDLVLLVCPIDSEAPAGRMILPQVQAIRELLDRNAAAIVVQPDQIESTLSNGVQPKLVVTDSQAFTEVRRAIPTEIEVTSFSILLAAAKGDIELYREGLRAVDSLREGDRILIAESCTHQVSCEDIGRVKIPRWLKNHTGHKFEYTVISGRAPLPQDIDSYALVIQCGGCMVTRSQLQGRLRQARNAGVPITNYGLLIKKITIG